MVAFSAASQPSSAGLLQLIGGCSPVYPVNHADASADYFSQIKFWKTPIALCPDGSQQCVTYDKWVAAWTSITA